MFTTLLGPPAGRRLAFLALGLMMVAGCSPDRGILNPPPPDLEQQSEPPCDDCTLIGTHQWGDSFGPFESSFHCEETDPRCDLSAPTVAQLGWIRALYSRMSGWARDFIEGRILTGTLRIWTYRFTDSEGRTRVADLHHRGAWDAYARLHLWSGGMDDPNTLLDTLCHEAAHFKTGTQDENDPAWRDAYSDCMRN